MLRQEHRDFRSGGFKKAGFRWNELVHREVGAGDWADPNLDVAFSEAWIAVDDASCAILDLPAIRDRYFTIQVVNLWGETVANINERTYPGHPSGAFAFCTRGARMSLTAGTVRVDLPCRKARLLIRIELGREPKVAAVLQHQIRLRPAGSPRIPAPIAIPVFTDDALPGVEVFDSALAVLASEPDINPGASGMQALVRAVVAVTSSAKAERDRINDLIRWYAIPKLSQAAADMGQTRNGWSRPRMVGGFGADWMMRTLVNLSGMWGNVPSELVTLVTDPENVPEGSSSYAMTFGTDDLPAKHVDYFWSLACLDAIEHRVVPNDKNRFLLDSRSPLVHGDDGSLTLYFGPHQPAGAPEPNWLPTPPGKPYVLSWRSYGPDQATIDGRWVPPLLRPTSAG